ncbi:TfoX/Sxy family DNA transformation protein [Vibrio neonatus]|uniref:TfoX/Sxy family DNA transformation protein n=1 Tax=Vibrio neonatus TaxID=278860 RepID=UPI0021C3A3F8|nr:TfoX/Sxy family DNA transformation protein [Vibrio neonatus]
MAKNGIAAVIEKIQHFNGLNSRSMFGGTGYFIDDAMFLLVHNEKAYLRGGPDLTDKLITLGCKQFKFQKRIGSARVQYYNIMDLYFSDPIQTHSLFIKSIENAKTDKDKCQHCHERIRDLPNLQLSTERMLARIDIQDVSRLKTIGSSESFRRLQSIYGLDLNINLLWKLEGAIQGVHFSLLGNAIKNDLLGKISGNQVGRVSNLN